MGSDKYTLADFQRYGCWAQVNKFCRITGRHRLNRFLKNIGRHYELCPALSARNDHRGSAISMNRPLFVDKLKGKP